MAVVVLVFPRGDGVCEEVAHELGGRRDPVACADVSDGVGGTVAEVLTDDDCDRAPGSRVAIGHHGTQV